MPKATKSKAGKGPSATRTAKASAIGHHAGLIYTMVLVSAADREMNDFEMSSIGQDVLRLPVFSDFDQNRLPSVAAECAELLDSEEGLETVLDMIARAIPDRLRETAYALACEIAAADGKVTQEESRILEMIRHKLDLGRLVSAAIERGARARAMRP
jgi:tellurite resistance protein